VRTVALFDSSSSSIFIQNDFSSRKLCWCVNVYNGVDPKQQWLTWSWDMQQPIVYICFKKNKKKNNKSKRNKKRITNHECCDFYTAEMLLCDFVLRWIGLVEFFIVIF
jgi:hypothetical protein